MSMKFGVGLAKSTWTMKIFFEYQIFSYIKRVFWVAYRIK